MLSLLTECTVLMLRVIHGLFWEQRITYDEFVNCTEVKIKFLLENLDSISTEVEKKNARDIINKCTSLISKDNDMSVFCLTTDIIQ